MNNWTREKHIALRQKMASVLPFTNQQLAFCKSLPNLDWLAIAFVPEPMYAWESILTVARNCDCLDALVDLALSQHLKNDPLLLALKSGAALASSANVAAKGSWKGQLDLQQTLSQQPTFVDVTWLNEGWKASRAVARIWMHDGAFGTGFLARIDGALWLVSNHHVLPSADKARVSRAQFDYQAGSTAQFVDLDETRFFTGGGGASAEDDWSVVGVLGEPDKQFGALELQPLTVQPSDWVNIIQHPDGLPKRLSYSGNVVCWQGVVRNSVAEDSESPTVLQYLTDTLPGSSGAPVFNRRWQVVAVHHASFEDTNGVQYESPLGSTRVFVRNQGILCSSLLAALSRAKGKSAPSA